MGARTRQPFLTSSLASRVRPEVADDLRGLADVGSELSATPAYSVSIPAIASRNSVGVIAGTGEPAKSGALRVTM